MKFTEPPSPDSAQLSLVFVGKNRSGDWVAQEQRGRFGGLFTSQAQAIKYALGENGRRREAIVELSCRIELDMGCSP